MAKCHITVHPKGEPEFSDNTLKYFVSFAFFVVELLNLGLNHIRQSYP